MLSYGQDEITRNKLTEPLASIQQRNTTCIAFISRWLKQKLNGLKRTNNSWS